MRHVNSYKNPGFNLGTDDSGLLNEDINGIEDFLNDNVEGDQINPEAPLLLRLSLKIAITIRRWILRRK